MLEKNIEEFRGDHPDIAAAYDTLSHAQSKMDATMSSADQAMSETIGRAVHLLKIGMDKMHRQMRLARGGNPDAEAKE
jgi:hypothetical protein